MAGNNNPWRDIYSLETWLHILKLTAADPKMSSHRAGIDGLTKLIAGYHMIDKRYPKRLDDRRQELQAIADAAAKHIATSGPVGVKSQKSVLDDKGSALRHKVQITPGGSTGTFESQIDPWVASLGKRALKKWAYIEQIQQFVNSTEATSSARNFISYLKKQVSRDRSGDLLPLTAGTKMEMIDPLHRDFEFHAHADGSITDPKTAMATALKDWIAKAPDTPFFYWLEGHSICTSSRRFDETTRVAKVNYKGDEDASVFRVWLQGKILKARGLLSDDGGSAFTTEGYGTKPGHAFVWLKDGTLLSHLHRSGEFHHSSFSGGTKVRCAGTWKVKDGKITMMDNNSGHYQPSDGHFMTLLKLLHDGGATDASIKVGTHSTVQGFGSHGAHSGYLSVDSYLNKVENKTKTYSYDLTNLATGT